MDELALDRLCDSVASPTNAASCAAPTAEGAPGPVATPEVPATTPSAVIPAAVEGSATVDETATSSLPSTYLNDALDGPVLAAPAAGPLITTLDAPIDREYADDEPVSPAAITVRIAPTPKIRGRFPRLRNKLSWGFSSPSLRSYPSSIARLCARGTKYLWSRNSTSPPRTPTATTDTLPIPILKEAPSSITRHADGDPRAPPLPPQPPPASAPDVDAGPNAPTTTEPPLPPRPTSPRTMEALRLTLAPLRTMMGRGNAGSGSDSDPNSPASPTTTSPTRRGGGKRPRVRFSKKVQVSYTYSPGDYDRNAVDPPPMTPEDYHQYQILALEMHQKIKYELALQAQGNWDPSSVLPGMMPPVVPAQLRIPVVASTLERRKQVKPVFAKGTKVVVAKPRTQSLQYSLSRDATALDEEVEDTDDDEDDRTEEDEMAVEDESGRPRVPAPMAIPAPPPVPALPAVPARPERPDDDLVSMLEAMAAYADIPDSNEDQDPCLAPPPPRRSSMWRSAIPASS
ncbi:hypothetical protein AMAG_00261 [Allomyces macrogynus ATCC 38327]|uniref:Uncharacterized protein n=1 Tax=Allomyces macrogynus (strain ATCC 38327) TaxID=578462 RepID=A0A0L0RVU2_ALLM3|nr:hypothetical protein AMAG_00261 [Allomyces macrogynus ATCC 38327]|eukprot:KNE54269.1 hypothetical protein AMAG_00261 [Allomyces macrogynus ATCC 38327]